MINLFCFFVVVKKHQRIKFDLSLRRLPFRQMTTPFILQINLLFLINIVRIVLLKSQGPSDLSSHSEGAHIKKALRATIILFPLLGKLSF